MARKKIGLIGAGNIGGELANLAVTRQLGDVVLFDIPAKENFAKGKALDLEQATALSGADARVSGTSKWEDLAGADVLIVTAGIPRKPGQSRDDLVATNLPIIRDVADNAKKHCPNAFVIVISNPLDAMVYEFKRRTDAPAEKVVGMAGVLDSARFSLFLAREAGASIKDVRADGARRPRRRHGAAALVHHDQRRARTPADRQGRAGEAGRPHAQGRRRNREPDGHQRVLRARGRGDRHGRGLPRSTRSACCPAPRTWKASTATRTCTWACRSLSAKAGSRSIIEVELDEEEKGMLKKSADSVQKVVDVVKAAG